MKRNVIAFALLIAVVNGFSQNAPLITKNIVAGGNQNDATTALDSTMDKGVIIAATTVSANNALITRRVANGFTDALVMRYDSLGNLLWSTCYGGSKTDILNDIKQTADGGFIAVGKSNSTNYDLPANNDSVYSNIWVVKLSETGSVQWSKVFGNRLAEDAVSVLQIADGSYVIAGFTGSADLAGSIMGGSDLLVIKLNASGDSTVFKRYGGSRDDLPAKIIQLANGNYVVVGSTETPNNGIITGNHSTDLKKDIWVVWLDSNLNHLENRCYGGAYGSDQGTDVLELSNGDLIVSGNVPVNSGGDVHQLFRHGGTEGWVARINRNIPRPYDTLWTRTYGGNADDYLRSMVKTPDDNVIIGLRAQSSTDTLTDITDKKSGPTSTSSDVWLAKINTANAAIIYRRCYGTTTADDLERIILRKEGLVFGGTITTTRDADLANEPVYGLSDLWIAHLSDNLGSVNRIATITPEPSITTVKPQPVKMYLQNSSMVVNYTSNEKQPGVVQLLNVNGQLIRSYKVTFEKGFNAMELHTGQLPGSVMYIGVLKTGNQKHSIKMIK